MCCFFPCIRYLQSKVDPEHDVICMVIFTEIIRWFTISVPILLSVWRYAEILGYTVFIPGMEVKLQFWLVTTAIFIGGSLLLYLPMKIVCSLFWKDARYTSGWRPSIVMYIITCALPCLLILLLAIDQSHRHDKLTEGMDPMTTLTIQVTVMGLTITEWMAKMREEHLTFDLTFSMATDFFFAYDVIDFFMLSAFDIKIYQSNWLYVTFVLGFFAMFKYIPNQPTTMNEHGSPKGAVTCILVSMIFNDIPFLFVRFATMAEYGLEVSDIIHPAKNVAMICLGLTQLYIIYRNYQISKNAPEKVPFSERRCSRHPHPEGRPGTLRGGPRMSTRSDTVDDCTCEDVEEMEARRAHGGTQERRGSPSRVYPQIDYELETQEEGGAMNSGYNDPNVPTGGGQRRKF